MYALQAPANRIGSQHLDPAQIKILQEIITRLVFIPFSVYYMHQPFRMDFRCAGPRLSGAGYFIFREVWLPDEFKDEAEKGRGVVYRIVRLPVVNIPLENYQYKVRGFG